MDILKTQAFLRASGIDAWMITDHHGRDPIAREICGPAVAAHTTRRWYYLIPAEGEPLKLVHRIEAGKLDGLRGATHVYARWQEQRNGVLDLCRGMRRIAMQYSENGELLLLSNADAGVVDLVRTTGAEVVSSGELVQELLAVFTPAQIELHREAGRRVDRIRSEAFSEVRRNRVLPTETDLRTFIRNRFRESGLTADEGPVVAAGRNTGDPHYDAGSSGGQRIEEGDLLLLDLWAKVADEPDAPYYDITWVASVGAPHDERVEAVFRHVRDAREAAISLVRDRITRGRAVFGFEVDDASRAVIERAGFGERFVHRTGHSIGTSVHGFGANMDNFECRDERRIVSGTCFSVEPGIYLPEFGVRLEVNVLVEGSAAAVTGETQETLVIL